jgi:hypothetical protein
LSWSVKSFVALQQDWLFEFLIPGQIHYSN